MADVGARKFAMTSKRSTQNKKSHPSSNRGKELRIHMYRDTNYSTAQTTCTDIVQRLSEVALHVQQDLRLAILELLLKRKIREVSKSTTVGRVNIVLLPL